VFSREELLKTVWPDNVLVTDRTVDVHITRLRKKIAPYDRNIVTRLGYGYCFEM
jgi:DNA-binding response OmpR family regulator